MSGSEARRICVVTGSRADFGILLPLLQELQRRPEADLRLVATASHLSPEFGRTVEEIRATEIPVADEVEVLLSSDSPGGVAKSLGLASIGLADSFRRLVPHLVVLLGDRYEILGAASAAAVMGIPIAHIHGGEVTEGAIDDSIRHAVTKLSHWHFVSTEEYRRRVIQLGEAPERVFRVGALGLDRVVDSALPDGPAVRRELALPDGLPVVLVTYHPDTAEPDQTLGNLDEVLAGLARIDDCLVVFTKANADYQGRMINARLAEFVEAHDYRFLYDSLGSRRYLGLAREASVVVGNSSSGILEVPFLGTPTVNVGDRQRGRVAPDTVKSIAAKADAVADSIRAALALEFDLVAARARNPYYAGGAAVRIADVITTHSLPSIKKRFVDAGT